MNKSTDSGRRFTRYALTIGAMQLVNRTLKSGRDSPYFFNSGLFYSGNASVHLAQAYAARIHEDPPEVLFGPAYKGIPIAVAIAVQLQWKYNLSVDWSFNRKEEKDHGEGGTIVGAPLNGRLVLIPDDVITTGGTGDEAVSFVRKNEGILRGYIIAFDRQERGDDNCSAAEAFGRKHGIEVRAASNLDDLVAVLTYPVSSIEEKALPKILEYRTTYGA